MSIINQLEELITVIDNTFLRFHDIFEDSVELVFRLENWGSRERNGHS